VVKLLTLLDLKVVVVVVVVVVYSAHATK